MSTKHFINDPVELVATALRSVPLTNPSLGLDEDNKIIYRKSAPSSVAIVSGGGAGHEPSFVSFVGDGILRAAVSGTIFASPSVKQIHNCITRRVNPNSGVLLIVMNYTGDILHFGLASEKAQASGIDVDLVVVGDDVGVGREKGGKVGRRGIAGTVLVHKIAGALAATGASLKETTTLATLVSKNLVSVGSSLEHVHVPGRSSSSEDHESYLSPDEIEIGMGIHNEQGFKRMKIPAFPDLVKLLLGQLLNKEDKDRNYLQEVDKDEGWILMINNLGGVSPLEMGGITAEVSKQLAASYSIKPKRVFTGTYMTSLNGNGFSITLLRLVDTGLGAGKSMIDLLDAHHETTGWTASVKPQTWDTQDVNKGINAAGFEAETTIESSGLKIDVNKFSKILTSGLKKVIAAEAEITKYDELVGDGDCGIGLKRGAEAVLQYIQDGKLDADAVVAVANIADVIEESMDGTSGAIYSIFVNSLVKALRDAGRGTAILETWSNAALAAAASLGKYTPAQPGDRTLIDALHPFILTLAETKDVKAAAKAARKGAESTRGMRPRLGRTVYIGEIGDTPDPGAIGIAVLVEGFAEAV
ncbi:dihydroxyacetone kinase Dak1 [Rhizina undulata]